MSKPASCSSASQLVEQTETQVILLKKSQGSVWLEVARTPLCPTVRWLLDNFGAGQYEMRLRSGNRVLCMTGATAS